MLSLCTCWRRNKSERVPERHFRYKRDETRPTRITVADIHHNVNNTSEANGRGGGKVAGSIVIIGAGAFGLSTAYSLLKNPRYDNSSITILDQWPSSEPTDSDGVTPASIDNSRVVRPDYASKPYAQLASRASALWRAGWPLTLSVAGESSSSADGQIEGSKPLLPKANGTVHQPYRESGLLLTSWEEGASSGCGVCNSNPRGSAYVDASLVNVREMAASSDKSLQGKIHEFKTPEEVGAALHATAGKNITGDRGYINEASGWADAGAAMAGLRERVKTLIELRSRSSDKKGSVIFREGPEAAVGELTFTASKHEGDDSQGKPKITGVRLLSGEAIEADLTILSAGAWTPRLLPRTLGRRIQATGQVIGYLGITADEAHRLANIPVALNMSSGLFVCPPIHEPDGSFSVKIARHGWGYRHEVQVPVPEVEKALFSSQTTTTANEQKHASENGSIVDLNLATVNLPAPASGTRIAQEGGEIMSHYVTAHLGIDASTPWRATRTCWYSDTATGDWLIDYAPSFADDSLFVATGGSGHGFKFTPVLGEWIVKAIERKLGVVSNNSNSNGGSGGEANAEAETDAKLGSMLKECWRWRSDEEDERNWLTGGDGSRAGPKDMWWNKELENGVVSGSV